MDSRCVDAGRLPGIWGELPAQPQHWHAAAVSCFRKIHTKTRLKKNNTFLSSFFFSVWQHKIQTSENLVCLGLEGFFFFALITKCSLLRLGETQLRLWVSIFWSCILVFSNIDMSPIAHIITAYNEFCFCLRFQSIWNRKEIKHSRSVPIPKLWNRVLVRWKASSWHLQRWEILMHS